MLMLLFKLQEDAYAIDSTKVIEVIPYLNTQKIPMTPNYIPGMANYRGNPIPVIDLGQLINGLPCQQRMSTRIILTSLTMGGEIKKIVGLLAENVTETIKTPKGWLLKPSEKGPVFLDNDVTGHPMVRLFQPEQMLPEDLPGLSFVE